MIDSPLSFGSTHERLETITAPPLPGASTSITGGWRESLPQVLECVAPFEQWPVVR
jgi:hypothetical protein